MQGSFLTRSRISTSWLFNPPVQGLTAALLTVASVAVPTAISSALPADIDAGACTLLCPFVLLVAVLSGWRFGLASAIGNALVCDITSSTPYGLHFDRNALAVVSTFVAYSALILILVGLFRRTAARSLRQAGAKERPGGIVFSLDDGQAWASWYGVDAPVRLGPPEEVVPMMQDFIAQMEVARRLQSLTSTKGVI